MRLHPVTEVDQTCAQPDAEHRPNHIHHDSLTDCDASGREPAALRRVADVRECVGAREVPRSRPTRHSLRHVLRPDQRTTDLPVGRWTRSHRAGVAHRHHHLVASWASRASRTGAARSHEHARAGRRRRKRSAGGASTAFASTASSRSRTRSCVRILWICKPWCAACRRPSTTFVSPVSLPLNLQRKAAEAAAEEPPQVFEVNAAGDAELVGEEQPADVDEAEVVESPVQDQEPAAAESPVEAEETAVVESPEEVDVDATTFATERPEEPVESFETVPTEPSR